MENHKAETVELETKILNLKSKIVLVILAKNNNSIFFPLSKLEWYCEQFSCKIIVINNVYKTPRQELLDDFMSIMHTFSSKLYFLRSYEKNIKKKIEKGVNNSE